MRDLQDAARIADLLPAASSAIVVGGGFLGMEVGSTLRHHGMTVTAVDRVPPLLEVRRRDDHAPLYANRESVE